MKPNELIKFLEDQDLTNLAFAEILGVSKEAVDHWVMGRRAIPDTTAKLIRLFGRRPELMKEL